MCQLELFEKLLTLKIVTCEDHQVHHIALCDAIKFIRNKSQNLGLWLYVDGVNTNYMKIDTGMISSAHDIILTRPLVGG